MPLQNVRLLLEYDGSGFHGWQKQPGVRTIQEELEKALRTVLRSDIGPLHASGRTDAGVHARAQVVNFEVDAPELDLRRLRFALSSILRAEISVLAADIVPNSFNARMSALSKQYSYYVMHRDVPPVLERGRLWFRPQRLNIELMQSSAHALVGTHDFSSFRGNGCNARSPVREIYESELEWKYPILRYRVVGAGFLKQMVRNIVGTLIAIGDGSLKLSMQEVLEKKDRRVAGVTAPAYGLFLEWVKYPELLPIPSEPQSNS